MTSHRAEADPNSDNASRSDQALSQAVDATVTHRYRTQEDGEATWSRNDDPSTTESLNSSD